MKNLLKNPLKLIAAGMFVVAMGFGMSTSLKVSETANNVDLFALSSAVAQGEGGSGEGEGEWLCDFAPNWPSFPAWTVRIQCYSGSNLCIDTGCLYGSC